MSAFSKGVYYLKEAGLSHTLSLTLTYIGDRLRMIWFSLCARLLSSAKKKALSLALSGKTVFVFTPSVEWNDLYQRAQQMASSYAQREGCAVVYLTTQRHFDNIRAVKEIKPGVFLANKALARQLDDILGKASLVVTCVFNLTYYEPGLFSSDRLVYEYVDSLRFIVSKADDFSAFEARHRALLASADVSVATATKLYDEIKPYAKKALLLPNAADYDFFANSSAAAPASLTKRLEKYSLVFEYYGALAEWFDYSLIKATAERHPDWAWVLIGRVIGRDMEKSGLSALENVIYVPPVAFSEIPSYIAAADIMTIPFIINQTTEATSPVKLFEYMAAGKPIITSAMPECMKYASAMIYNSTDEFEALAVRAAELKNDASYKQLLKKEALENTWLSRCSFVTRILFSCG